jgi:hypothetical protein
MMPRYRLSLFAQGLAYITIVAALVVIPTKIVHTATAPTTTGPDATPASLVPESTQAKDLQGSIPRFFAIGGSAEAFTIPSTTELAETQATSTVFQAGTPRILYPGTLSPLPEDVFRTDQPPYAIKLIGD